jgi:hypothetical protein
MKTTDAIRWGGGTQVLLAQRLGMRQSSISAWGEFPPALRQLQIEHLSDGRLRAEPECLQANGVPETLKD